MAKKNSVKLVMDHQPPAEWYKDEGDKHFEFSVRLDGKVTAAVFGAHERVPIHVSLLYESGKMVEDQHSLLECIPTAPVMELKEKHCSLRIRIKEVSSRHRHQQFVVKAELAGIKGLNSVTTDPIRVLSKHTRHNRKRKRALKQAQTDSDGFDPVLAKEDPVKLTVQVLRSLEWVNIGRDKSVNQCPSCCAVHLIGVNNKVHKPRCKLRHLISVFARAPQAGATAATATGAGAVGAGAGAGAGASAGVVAAAAVAGTPRARKMARRTAAGRAPAVAAAPIVPIVAGGHVAPLPTGVSSGMLMPPNTLPISGSFDFDREMEQLAMSTSMPDDTSALGKLARNFSIGSLVRSLSWGRSASGNEPAAK